MAGQGQDEITKRKINFKRSNSHTHSYEWNLLCERVLVCHYGSIPMHNKRKLWLYAVFHTLTHTSGKRVSSYSLEKFLMVLLAAVSSWLEN